MAPMCETWICLADKHGQDVLVVLAGMVAMVSLYLFARRG